MAQNPAQRTPSEYENAQEANKKYFSSGSGQSKFCKNFLKELNEKCEEAQVTAKVVNLYVRPVNITGLSSGAFIRVMQQIIQAIKEKHDVLQIRHGHSLTIVTVTYTSDPLVHHCEHRVWKDGQAGNYKYMDLGTYKHINSRMREISAKISDSGVENVLLGAVSYGNKITNHKIFG